MSLLTPLSYSILSHLKSLQIFFTLTSIAPLTLIHIFMLIVYLKYVLLQHLSHQQAAISHHFLFEAFHCWTYLSKCQASTEGPESLNYEPPIFYNLSLAFRLSTIWIKRSGSPVLPRLNSVLNSYIFDKAFFFLLN